MKYFTVTESELEAARPGIELMGRIDREDTASFIYGITTKADVLAEATESLLPYHDEDEPLPDALSEIVLAIPMTSDSLRFLTGSGWILQGEGFSYASGGDDVRSHWLEAKGSRLKVTLRDFSSIAVSDTEVWADEFLKKYGTKQANIIDAPAVVSREPVPAVHEPTSTQRATASKQAARESSPVYRNPIDIFFLE